MFMHICHHIAVQWLQQTKRPRGQVAVLPTSISEIHKVRVAHIH
jgi:hypothetical protein